MIKVVSFKICPFVQRVTAALEAKQIPYELEYISLKDKPQWFLDISPNGQVPLLITESKQVLFESDAIIEYIDEVYGELEEGRRPEEKALDRAWSYQASKNYLAQCSTMRSGNKETLEERAENLEKVFAKAEKKLGSGPFFKGESLSSIDIAWLPLLHRTDIIKSRTCYDLIEKFPRVQKWREELSKTGLYEKSVPEDFEKQFTDFYLSEKTYLGTNRNCEGVSDEACKTGSCC